MPSFLRNFFLLGIVAIPMFVLVPGLPWWKFSVLLASAQIYGGLLVVFRRKRKVEEVEAHAKA